MSKKKNAKKTVSQGVHNVFGKQQPEKDNTLIYGGVLFALSSIGLLIFVLSEKVFHLT